MTSGGKRKGAGRKPSPGARREVVGIRLDASGKAALTEAAKAKGQTLRAWLWDAIQAHLRSTVPK